MVDLQVLEPKTADFAPISNWVATIPIRPLISPDHLLLSNGVDSLLLSDGASFLLLGGGSGGGSQSVFRVKLIGNFQNVPDNIRWRYVLVDNIQNKTTFIISFNSYLLIVPAYSRQTFPIPSSCNEIALLNVQSDIDLVLSSAQPVAPDLDNQYEIAINARPRFPVTQYALSRIQLIDAPGETVQFLSPAFNINYTLLNPLILFNGFTQLLQNVAQLSVNSDPTYVTVIPPAGVTINNVFTNSSPMRLYPGDSGILVADDVNWNFMGTLSFQTNAFVMPVAGAGVTITNVTKRMLDSFVISLRCVTAELNYVIGDEIVIGTGTQLNAAGASVISGLIINASSIGDTFDLRMSSALPFAIPNKTTGVVTNITAANWRMVFRGITRW